MSASPHVDSALRRFVALTCFSGLAGTFLILGLSRTLWKNDTPALETTVGVFLLAVFVTTTGQSFYVRVRHGGTWEELNFYEVALGIGVLLLAPSTVLLASLCGVLVGEFLIRRERIKAVYNLGMYATATSAMIAVYETLMLLPEFLTAAERPSPTSAYSLLSLFVAAGVFTAVNLGILAGLLHVTVGAAIRDVLWEEQRLSLLMTLGSVGIAFTAVALAEVTPVAVPLALLPALAIWYAYGASAQHAEARDRNRWLVSLGGSLAQHGRGGGLYL